MLIPNFELLMFPIIEKIPSSFKMLIIGTSGCGKTQLLFKMLLTPNFLDYDNLIIFSKTVYQEEYQIFLSRYQKWIIKIKYY